MSHTARFVCGLSLSLLSLLPVGSAAVAQSAGVAAPVSPLAPVRLTATDASHFESALNALSSQAALTFVCEGQPLRMNLTGTETTKLLARLKPQEGVPADVAVEAVAEAFDYSAIRQTKSLYLLKKRFSDPGEIPAVGFAEILESLDNIHKAAAPFCPEKSNSDLLKELAESLTSEERVTFAKGVSVRDLTPDQQGLIKQFAFSTYLHQMESLNSVRERLKACRTSRTVFTRQEFFGLDLPVLQGPFYHFGAKTFQRSVFLSYWVQTNAGGGSDFKGGKGVQLVNQRIVGSGIDPTAPLPKSAAPTLKQRTCSLAELVRDLNERVAAKDAAGNASKATNAVFGVAPSVAAKPVLLIGDDRATPREVLDASAAVYGLTARASLGGAVRVTSPVPRTVERAEDLRSEIRRLLPEPFLRRIGGSQWKGSKAEDLYLASIKELRQIIEPAIAARPDKRLPIVEASDRARDLVALSSLSTCLYSLERVLRRAPSYAVNADQSFVKLTVGGPETPKTVGFLISYKGSNGAASGISGDIQYGQPLTLR